MTAGQCATPPDLLKLIEEAERTGMWLRSHYQSIWMSPKELRAANKDGRFLWGPINWELKSPDAYIQEHERAVRTAQQALTQAKEHVARAR